MKIDARPAFGLFCILVLGLFVLSALVVPALYAISLAGCRG